ncbi:DinB family protein [Amycolatopsis sp.]|uniref:DinB family protein n=1 Tax=Amycolatopsis sp. TaxID=37632 RepID=UPI002D7F4D01|nr:DinB family protein [Amycolatopsis sp.]HET6709415.1 DinB family protein [Amycolatopsis sp.]
MYAIPEVTTGSERELLEAMLDRGRLALVENARGLSEADARRRLVPSLTTPIALVKHVAVAERRWFQWLVGGLDEAEIDGPSTPGDPSFVVSDAETVDDVIAEYERTSKRSREIAARFSLDDRWTHPVVGEVTLRFIYLFLIEELARHTGHGDILREQITAR